MRNSQVPGSLAALWEARRGEAFPAEKEPDPVELVRFFRSADPAAGPDPFSQEHLDYFSALADGIAFADERLYEHYRALVDLFRAGVLRLPREALCSCPAWNPVREKGVRLGLLPPDLYGDPLPVPHVNPPFPDGDQKGGSRS